MARNATVPARYRMAPSTRQRARQRNASPVAMLASLIPLRYKLAGVAVLLGSMSVVTIHAKYGTMPFIVAGVLGLLAGLLLIRIKLAGTGKPARGYSQSEQMQADFLTSVILDNRTPVKDRLRAQNSLSLLEKSVRSY